MRQRRKKETTRAGGGRQGVLNVKRLTRRGMNADVIEVAGGWGQPGLGGSKGGGGDRTQMDCVKVVGKNLPNFKALLQMGMVLVFAPAPPSIKRPSGNHCAKSPCWVLLRTWFFVPVLHPAAVWQYFLPGLEALCNTGIR